MQLVRRCCAALALILFAAGCSSDSGNSAAVPAMIAIVSGNAQSGAVALPLAGSAIVQVTDQSGTPVSGVVVTFVASGDATVGHGSVLTDASGNASTTVILGQTVGADTVIATVAGVAGSATFAFAAQAGAAASLNIVSGNLQVGTFNATLPIPLVARVVDQFNNPVAGAAVDWARSAGTLVGSVQQLSAPDGTVSIVLQLPATAATVSVTATLHGTTTNAPFSETATDGIATTLTLFSGDLQSGSAGATLANPLVVRVTDLHGNPVAGATIDWTTTNGALIGSPSQITASDGTASIGFQLPATAGTTTITATLHGTAVILVFTAVAI